MSGFVADFRQRVNTMTREPGMASGSLHSVEDILAGSVPVRVYRPSGSAAPLLCYLHGAGFVAGDLNSHDQICRVLAGRVGAVVAAVDYRLAPEHPFPAALDDAVEAVDWLIGHADQVGADRSRWALAGDSAGGTLAAIIAQRRQGRPDGPVAQALICPALEFADLDSPSHREFATTEGFNTSIMEQMADLYLGTAIDRRDPVVSPSRAEPLTGLAPAIIISAELDPLRDDGEAYARRLIEAGVPVTSFRQVGMVHYGVSWCRAAPEVAPGIEVVVGSLSTALHGPHNRRGRV
ncbi:MAG: alpha/beta hydrolase [Actinomycetia bacterium]|nr:alpha/beta hydrolase [Actinomycetes bacterium]